MITKEFLTEFLEIEKTQPHSNNSSSDVSIIAGTKFVFSKGALAHLEITPTDIKKVKLLISVNHKANSMLIRKSPNMGLGKLLSGTASKPECYCADKCQDVLSSMKKCLTGSGTVKFLSVSHESVQIEDATVPVLLVDLNSASAREGVLADLEV